MTMKLIAKLIVLIPILFLGIQLSAAQSTDQIMTVTGPVESSELGFALTHEHVMSMFGQDPHEPGKYDGKAVKAQVLPYLQRIKAMGCSTIMECTAEYFGRNVNLLLEISESSGLYILTNTGWYAAAGDRYVPKKAYDLTTGEIADLWIHEWKHGIQNTGIRPGFIKLGVDNGDFTEIDRKLVEAGALAHLKTGLTIAVHTRDNVETAFSQIKILKAAGVHPSAWIWVHAQHAPDAAPLIKAARMGAWISLDGIKAPGDVQDHLLDLLNQMKKAGLLDQVLLSHDGNSFPSGGAIRPYHHLMETMIPALRDAGWKEKEIELMTVKNPAKAFAVRVRSLKPSS